MGRFKALEQSCLSAVDVAQERLLTLLKENAETEFGKKHEFSEICSVYDYKRKVPFSVFDDYAASVDRMMRGEKHVLTAYPISFYAHTSGTLGKTKNIPFSEKAEGLVRDHGKLGPLELILLQPQTFALYRDIQVWNGASPNQLKPVHVISTPNAEAFFRGLKI